MFKGLDNFTDYIFNMKDFANLDSIKNGFLKNLDNMKMFYCDFNYDKINNNVNFKRIEKIINIPFDFIWIENPSFYVDGFEILGIGIKKVMFKNMNVKLQKTEYLLTVVYGQN